MNNTLKGITIAVVAVLLGTVLIRAVSWGHGDRPAKGGDDVVQVTSHVVIQNGEAVVKLSAKVQERAGITVATLQKTRNRQSATAPATVLETEPLTTLRNQYVTNQNQVKKAEIAVGVERKEYARLKKLYAQSQNVSAKVVQAAQGQLLVDQADLGTARQQLKLERAAARQNWGGVVAEWVASGVPSLERVLELQDVLVEVTIPATQRFIKPRTVRLEIPAGGSVAANFVSSFPRVDPRIQGTSLLYLAPGRPGLVAGVNPVARFAAAAIKTGVLVPRSAVVWWQGNAWVYQEASPGHFTRRRMLASTPVPGGYFVTQGLHAGDKIVVRGAQELLSEEFRSEIQPED